MTAAIAIALVGRPTAAAAATPAPSVSALRALINATRAAHGLRPVRVSRLLNRSALQKAELVRRCRSFSHTPCGTPFARSLQQVGYLNSGARVGENLFWATGALGSPERVLAGWLASPPHRAILLGAVWRDEGLAVVHAPSLFGATDVWVWALQLGRRT